MSAPEIGDDERRLVDEVLRSGRLSMGPMLSRFEEEFAARFGVARAVGVSSGTAGLHLAMLAAGVGDGDLVVTSPFSFVASANAILYERGIPVFVDIDPVTLALDPARAAEAVDALARRLPNRRRFMPRGARDAGGALRAVLPVHVFGRPAELDGLAASARAHGVALVEDACEAIGARDGGRFAGTAGDAAVFAFYPNKQMTTGEGGMLVTPRADWDALFRSLRNQGRDGDARWLHHVRLGFNYRLDEMSAAVGLAQLRRLDALLARRRAVAAAYDERLRNVAGVSPLAGPGPGVEKSWFVYVVRLDPGIDRTRLMESLEARGVPTRPYFSPIHLQPFYRERFGFEPGDFPHTEEAARRLLALPFHAALSEDDLDYACACLAEEAARARDSAA
jgi:dTDP-4-amino-4,6-dideoxygalactose transaminase